MKIENVALVFGVTVLHLVAALIIDNGNNINLLTNPFFSGGIGAAIGSIKFGLNEELVPNN